MEEYLNNDEFEKSQKQLVNDFIQSGNILYFKKFMNARSSQKPKKSYTHNRANPYKPSDIYHRFNANHKQEMQRNIPYINYLDANSSSMTEEIPINRYNFYSDPQFKNNSLKGNMKWASQRFSLMKMNWAKRKGIPISEYQVPKVDHFQEQNNNKKEINGDLLNNYSPMLPKI